MSQTPNTQAPQAAHEFEGMSLEDLFNAADQVQPSEGQDFSALDLAELFAAADAIGAKAIYQD